MEGSLIQAADIRSLQIVADAGGRRGGYFIQPGYYICDDFGAIDGPYQHYHHAWNALNDLVCNDIAAKAEGAEI